MANTLAGILSRFPTRKLADSIGAHEQTISRWKNSHAIPPPEFLERIAIATGIPLAEISQAVADDKAARSAQKSASKKLASH